MMFGSARACPLPPPNPLPRWREERPPLIRYLSADDRLPPVKLPRHAPEQLWPRKRVLIAKNPKAAALSVQRLLGASSQLTWCPQGDSNPCLHLERVMSWSSRRWGRTNGRILPQARQSGKNNQPVGRISGTNAVETVPAGLTPGQIKDASCHRIEMHLSPCAPIRATRRG